jgi:sugar O-acyltransferase (sialic acid O-acetyltransferase NeuD family)
MKPLYIAGAGGFGREVFSWLGHMPEWNRDWDFKGFLDDNLAALDRFCCPPGVVGRLSDHVPGAGEAIVCAIGDPRTRLSVCQRLSELGAEFPVIRHPTSLVGAGCRIGEGSILCPGAIVTVNVVIGRWVVLNLHATVGHDAWVGDGVTLSPHADVTGFARVEEGAFLGSHVSVIPSTKVGAYSKVGAGSVVLHRVAPGATVMGVPARQILP